MFGNAALGEKAEVPGVASGLANAFLVIKTSRHWVRASDRHSCTSVTRSQKRLIWPGAKGAFSHGWPQQAKDRRGGWFFFWGNFPFMSLCLPPPGLESTCGLHSLLWHPRPGTWQSLRRLLSTSLGCVFSDSADLILGFSMMLSITLSATQDASVPAKCQQKVRKEISCNLKLITLPRS